MTKSEEVILHEQCKPVGEGGRDSPKHKIQFETIKISVKRMKQGRHTEKCRIIIDYFSREIALGR